MNYIKITILLLIITNIGCAQNHQSKNELEKEIIGSWHLENSTRDKITFFKDGTVKRFVDDELKSIGKYEITKKCDEEVLSNKNFFLKEIDANGFSSCAYIEAINYDNNGILSLMTKNQGKVVIYEKAGENP